MKEHKLRLGNSVYWVEPLPAEIATELNKFGDCNRITKQIRVEDGLAQASGELETYIHEILHAIVVEHHVPLTDDNEEQIVDPFGAGITQAIIDNPEFVKTITALANKARSELAK